VITLTPIDDFVGTLKATNRLMMIVIAVLTIVELFFIYLASSRLSRPVENVSQQLQAIESLQFELPVSRPSKIREIARLESAASLLRTSLKSFASFVPLDVVRQLIKSGIPLTLGVEPRFLTVFFSDLENFSSHSESLAPADLLIQISTYPEEVSGARRLRRDSRGPSQRNRRKRNHASTPDDVCLPVYDPCCGSGGMFVQSEKFALEHEGRIGDIAIYGQESNYTTLFCRSRSCFFQGLQCILHGRIEPLGCARCRSGGDYTRSDRAGGRL
jgi:hypothetical protein